ncbi:MAG: Holliday junction branch migration protein RuvA [Thiotrichales bacterium]|nr:Holliday junction branch migration protein RuvA [Thiotrichales bacterium]
MIGFLKGNLVKKQPPWLWMDVQGVGYEMEAPISTFAQLQTTTDNQSVLLLTYMHVREDAIQLYAFASEAERTLFKTLLKVNGIGTKMALTVLSSMSVNEFCHSVEQGDHSALMRIPGVGKKTAERLQIEIRDRLKPLVETGVLGNPSEFALTASGRLSKNLSASETGDEWRVQQKALEALMALGYKTAQAESLLKEAYTPGMSLEALIKAALRGVKI